MPPIAAIYIRHTKCISGAPHPVLAGMGVFSELKEFVDSVWIEYCDTKKAAEVSLELERRIRYTGQDANTLFPGMYHWTNGRPRGYLQFRCPLVKNFEAAVETMNGGSAECLVTVHHHPGSDWEELTERSWMNHDLVCTKLGYRSSSWYHFRRVTDRDGKQLVRRHKHTRQKNAKMAAKYELEREVNNLEVDIQNLCSLLQNRVRAKAYQVWQDRAITPTWEQRTLTASYEAWRLLVVNRPKAKVCAWLAATFTGEDGKPLTSSLEITCGYVACIHEVLGRWKKDNVPAQCVDLSDTQTPIWPQIVRWCQKQRPDIFKKKD